MKQRTETMEPTARIAVQKNLQKVHDGTNVYLNKNEEFQIEFYNPKKDEIMASVIFDENPETYFEIILRPGERFFLDCNPITKKRFKFDTYYINDNKANRYAIEDNGVVTIKFFNRQQKYQQYLSTWMPYGTTTPSPYNTGTYIGTSTYNTSRTKSFPLDVSYTSNVIGDLQTTSVYQCSGDDQRQLLMDSVTPKSVETGRVIEGSSSNQNFINCSFDSEVYPCTTYKYKMLPVSQKPIYSDDIKQYCTQCGTKIRNEKWTFCPSCGKKI